MILRQDPCLLGYKHSKENWRKSILHDKINYKEKSIVDKYLYLLHVYIRQSDEFIGRVFISDPVLRNSIIHVLKVALILEYMYQLCDHKVDAERAVCLMFHAISELPNIVYFIKFSKKLTRTLRETQNATIIEV